LGPIVTKLLSASLERSSVPTYQRAWHLLHQFTTEVFDSASLALPVAPTTLSLFIAYLFDHEYASSTVATYVTAIGYYHRLAGIPDPSKTSYIIEMLKGYHKLSKKLDTRLPITLPILHRIIKSCDITCSSQYTRLLFIAMCTLAFFDFLRVGEMSVTHGHQSARILQFSQVTRLYENGEVSALQDTFHDFKHNYNQALFSITVTRKSDVCPVLSMLRYLEVRGCDACPLFINSCGRPVSRCFFASLLERCIKSCNLNSERYKGHSFRIGGATFAAQQGLSDAQIRLLGRWKSEAFKKYIRVSNLPSL